MSSYLEHTIQHSRDNSALDVACNENTTAVLSSKGQVHLAGIVKNKIQAHFEDSNLDRYVDGKILKVALTEDKLFVLNEGGKVYEYDPNYNGCDTPLREIPLPSDCDSDPVVDIQTGRAHLLMLTKSKQAYGYGDNSQYQIVPAGDCKYDSAQKIHLGDFIKMKCEDKKFEGVVNMQTVPVKPVIKDCKPAGCVATPGTGYYGTIDSVILSDEGSPPKYACADLDYSATTSFFGSATDSCGLITVSGSIGICVAPKAGQTVCLVDGTGTQAVPVDGFFGISQGFSLGDGSDGTLIYGPVPINVQLTKAELSATGNCFEISLEQLGLSSESFTDLSLQQGITIRNSQATPNAVVAGSTPYPLNIDFTSVYLNVSCVECKPVTIPEPSSVCITKISAGYDISALVDDKGRVFTLGNLHTVRENEYLFDRPCLDSLLGQAGATLEFPADQLACKVGKNNENCVCREDCRDAKQFDLSKAKVTLSPFLNLNTEQTQNCGECYETNPVVSTNICKYLEELKKCNETEYCYNTCEPCDNTVYLKLKSTFNSPLAIVNEKSICKVLSYFQDSISNVDLFDLGKILANSAYEGVLYKSVVFDPVSSRIDYDNNGYVVDCVDFPIDLVLLLIPPEVQLSIIENFKFHAINVDISQGLRSLQFTEEKFANIKFDLPCSKTSFFEGTYIQAPFFFLSFSDVLTPQVRGNLREALGRFSFRHCPEFKRPISNRIFGTYIKGGDCVLIGSSDDPVITHQGTADLPLAFCLAKRVNDIAVGDRSIHAVVDCSPCPKEVYAIGNNCYGQLGLCNSYSTLCFKKVNRCLFDCSVSKVFAGQRVTAYVTASGKTYLSGQFSCVVKSDKPVEYKGVYDAKKISISKFNMFFLTKCYDLWGLGDNQFGQIGTGSTCKVSCPKKIKICGYECSSVCAPCRPTPSWKCESSCSSKKSKSKACCSSCAKGSTCSGKEPAVPAKKKTYTYPCKNTKTSLPPCTPWDTCCSKPKCKTPSGISGCTGKTFKHPGMKVY